MFKSIKQTADDAARELAAEGFIVIEQGPNGPTWRLTNKGRLAALATKLYPSEFDREVN